MDRRPDIDAKDVARRWLDGETIEVLAFACETTMSTIKRRLELARELYPNLPWDKRELKRQPNPVKDYIEMKDGKAPGRALKTGSIIRGRRRR